jgi:hypothetical protein
MSLLNMLKKSWFLPQLSIDAQFEINTCEDFLQDFPLLGIHLFILRIIRYFCKFFFEGLLCP